MNVIKARTGRVTGSDNPNTFNIFGIEDSVTVTDGASADTITIANVNNAVRLNHGGGGDLVRVSNAGSLTIVDTPQQIDTSWRQQLYDIFAGDNTRTPTNRYAIEHVDTLRIQGSDDNDYYELNYDFGFNRDRLDGVIDGKGGANVVRISAPVTYFSRQYDSNTNTLILTGPHGERLELKNITRVVFAAEGDQRPYTITQSSTPALEQEMRYNMPQSQLDLAASAIPTPQNRFAVVDVDTGEFNITNDPQQFMIPGRHQQVIDTINATGRSIRDSR